MGNKAELFVKAQSAFVASPNVQRQIVASVFLCKIHNKIIERASDVLTAQALVNAEIVYVKRFYVCQNIVVFVLLKNAKRVSENAAFAVNGNEYRARVIAQNGVKLCVGVFLCATLENIGSAAVMHLKHLAQKDVYSFCVPTVGTYYFEIQDVCSFVRIICALVTFLLDLILPHLRGDVNK